MSDAASSPEKGAVTQKSRMWNRLRESGVMSLLSLSAGFSIFVTTTIVIVLIYESSYFFSQAAHEWEETAPLRIEEYQAAIAVQSERVSQAKQQLAELESGADPAEGDIAAVRRRLRDSQEQLAFAEKSLQDWRWKAENANTVGVARSFWLTKTWSPQYTQDYGIWPLITGTLSVALIAMVVALPLGLITAIYLSEYAPRGVRATLKPTLEILAGIPTVVYGYFALRVVTPSMLEFHVWLPNKLEAWFGANFVSNWINSIEQFERFNSFSAGLMVGILCLPIVTSLTEDALQAVPRSLRDAAFGLGSTRFDVSVKVVVPAALSGIISAFLLAIARAVGETMIVALAAGATPNLTLDPRDQIQTMTGYMVQIMGGDAPHGTPEYSSLYAVAAVLFVMTLSLTIIGNIVRKRFREAYQ